MAGSGWELVVRTGDRPGPGIPIPEQGRMVIGRDRGCDLVLEDARVSARHASVGMVEAVPVLEDLGSRTGTRVNGVAGARHRLASGDRIEVGATTLEVRRQGEAAAGSEGSVLGALTDLLADPEGDPEPRLEACLDRLLGCFEADRAMLLAPREPGGFEVVCRRNRPGSPLAGDGEPSRRLIERIAAEGHPRLLSSLETEEMRQAYRSIAGRLASIVAAPLPLHPGVGVLYLDSVAERHRLEDRDRDLLMAFARAAGVVLARERQRRLEGARLAAMERRDRTGSELLGSSAAIRRTREEIAQAAGSDLTVLVTGDSGTGKELVARALHRESARGARAFVAVNCGAIPADLVESELFGHERGAFSGAEARRLGQFELADGGTLFLDEIGELAPTVQAKLLRALEERTIRRVGGNAPVPVDFRLVAATNVDLELAVKEGRFRQDLFFRLAVFRIRLVPLAARPEDVPELSARFLADAARRFRRPVRDFSPEASALLARHPWPGNVRELRNLVEQAVVRETSDRITPASLFPSPSGGPGPGPLAAGGGPTPTGPARAGEDYSGTLEEARRAFERRFLEARLAEGQGNMRATAQAIGLSRTSLYAKCQELGIDVSRFR